MNSLEFGLFIFDDLVNDSDEGLGEGNCIISNSLPSDELSVDTMEVDVRSKCLYRVPYETSNGSIYTTVDGKVYLCRFGANDIRTTPYGTPVYFYHDTTLIAKMYLKTIKRKNKTVFTVSCVSAVGLLDKLPHYGGLYDGDLLSVVLAYVVGGVFSYTLAPELQNIPVFGLLPAATRRENLHQLMFAQGISITKDAAGTVQFTFLTGTQSTNIPNDRLYLEGEIDYMTPVTGADVAEYAYLALSTDPVETLFDNTDGSGAVDHKTITFKGPHHDLVVTGSLVKNEEGVNYAVLTGTGTLTGKAHTEQKKIVSVRQSTSGPENIARVEGYTLVNIANSENVLARVMSYYSSASTIRGSLTVGAEKPGDRVNFEDPFDDPAEAFLQAADIIISRTLKASATFISGFEPGGYGNYYKNSVVLTANGNWTPPAGVTKIRAVLIEGGQGGYSGCYGEQGATGGGPGGIGGIGGRGGKILNQQLPVTPGVPIAAVIGQGGLGANANVSGSVEGALGTATTFGGLTSDSGVPAPNGFLDIFTGLRYGGTGEQGLPGGKGKPDGFPAVYKRNTFYPGDRGWHYDRFGQLSTQTGGWGGGAATGSDGENGQDSMMSEWGGGGYVAINGSGGTGGVGADADEATGYGNGGKGGNGGGGGGQSTGYLFSNQGAGGRGGKGSNGRPGCVIIYF